MTESGARGPHGDGMGMQGDLLREGRYGAAAGHLEQAADAVGRGANDAAVRELEKALEKEAERVSVMVRAADLLGVMGRFHEAEREIRRAQRIAPDDIDVRVGVALLLFRRGLYAEAEEELGWVCSRDPEHTAAHLLRGEALNRLGRVDAAMAVLEEAIRLDPDNPRPYHTLGILFDRIHLPQRAAEMYRRARQLGKR